MSGGGNWRSGRVGGGDARSPTSSSSPPIPPWLISDLLPPNLAFWGPQPDHPPPITTTTRPLTRPLPKPTNKENKDPRRSVGKEGVPLITSEPIASYNWDVDAWLPTIVVPGRPKVYRAWAGGILECKDEEMVKDEDTFRNPLAPLEPALLAVRLLRPDFNLSGVDVIVDLNSLKHLARFLLYASGDLRAPLNYAEQVNHEVFRIGLQTLGSIVGRPSKGPVVLLRHEERFQARWIGYGAAFVRACLQDPPAPELQGPFKQVSLMKMGSLRLMVRHKVSAIRVPEKEDTTDKGPAIVSWPDHGLNTTVRVRRSLDAAGPLDGERLLFGSLGLSCDRLSVDKWLDQVFTGAERLCLGRHYRGNFRRTDWLPRQAVKRLCGGAWDEVDLMERLEDLLRQLSAWTRTRVLDPASRSCLSGECAGGKLRPGPGPAALHPATLHLPPRAASTRRPRRLPRPRPTAPPLTPSPPLILPSLTLPPSFFTHP